MQEHFVTERAHRFGEMELMVCIVSGIEGKGRGALLLVSHLGEEGSNGDSLALVDVVEGGTQRLHDGGETRARVLGHGSVGSRNQSLSSIHYTAHAIKRTLHSIRQDREKKSHTSTSVGEIITQNK